MMTTWYLLDAAAFDYASVLAQMQLDHESRITADFSYIVNLAGDRTFAKVVAGQPTNYTAPPILATYDETTYKDAPPFTRAFEWEAGESIVGSKRPTTIRSEIGNCDSFTVSNSANILDASETTFGTIAIDAPAGAAGLGYVVAAGFSFNVPRRQVMTGFEISIRLREAGASNNITLKNMQIVTPGGLVGSVKSINQALSNSPSEGTVYTYGGQTDAWGTTAGDITWESINGSDFGVRIGLEVPAGEVWTANAYIITARVFTIIDRRHPNTAGAIHNLHKLDIFEYAADERVTMIGSGNSNWQYGGRGLDAHIQNALFDPAYGNYPQWATGPTTAMSTTGDVQGDTWAPDGHPSLAMPVDGSPPAGWTTAMPGVVANLGHSGLCYRAAGSSMDWTQSYCGQTILSNSPMNVHDNIDLYIYGWGFSTGTGKIEPGWRYTDGTNRTDLGAINTNVGADGVYTFLSTIPAATRAAGKSLQFGAKTGGFTSRIHDGPFAWGLQRAVIRGTTTGISFGTMMAWGGHDLRDQIKIFLDLPTAQQDYLLAHHRKFDVNRPGADSSKQRVIYWVHEGLNSRNDADLSIGTYPFVGNTGLGYADNLRKFVDTIIARYNANGWDTAYLSFIFSIDHYDGAVSDMANFRTAAKAVSDAYPRCGMADINVVAPRSLLLANNWYSSGGGAEHLEQAGYQYIGQQLALEIRNRFNP